MRLHAVLGLVLLHAESAYKGLGGGGVLVKEVPLEVAEVLDYLPAEQALVPIRHLPDRQPSSKEKKVQSGLESDLCFLTKSLFFTFIFPFVYFTEVSPFMFKSL